MHLGDKSSTLTLHIATRISSPAVLFLVVYLGIYHPVLYDVCIYMWTVP